MTDATPTKRKPRQKKLIEPEVLMSPPTTDIATQPPDAAQRPPAASATEIILCETEVSIQRFVSYSGLKIADIHDKKEIKALHDKRMEVSKTIKLIDDTRLKLDEDDRRRIKARMEVAKKLIAVLEPIKIELKAEEERAELALEAERVAAKQQLLNDRKSKLAAIVGQFVDLLTPYPDDYLSSVSDDVFNSQLTIGLTVQVEQRKLFAAQEAERIAREAAEAAAAAQREREAAEERQRLQELEDKRRAEEQAQLQRDREAFENEQRETADRLQREAAERDRIAAEQREAAETELRLKREAMEKEWAELKAQQERDAAARLEAEAKAKRDAEAATLAAKAVADAETYSRRLQALKDTCECGQEIAGSISRDRMVAMTDDEFSAECKRATDLMASRKQAAELIEAKRPDIDKMRSWILTIESTAAESRPSVSSACEDQFAAMKLDLALCITKMKARLL